MESNLELVPADARSISRGLWHMSQLAQDAAGSLDAMLEDEELDGQVEAAELRECWNRFRSSVSR